MRKLKLIPYLPIGVKIHQEDSDELVPPKHITTVATFKDVDRPASRI